MKSKNVVFKYCLDPNLLYERNIKFGQFKRINELVNKGKITDELLNMAREHKLIINHSFKIGDDLWDFIDEKLFIKKEYIDISRGKRKISEFKEKNKRINKYRCKVCEKEFLTLEKIIDHFNVQHDFGIDYEKKSEIKHRKKKINKSKKRKKKHLKVTDEETLLDKQQSNYRLAGPKDYVSYSDAMNHRLPGSYESSKKR